MRKSIVIAAIAVSISFAGAFGATPAKPPAELDTARKSLATAIAAHDLKAIAALASFPLAVDAYETSSKLTEKKFLGDKNQFTNIFGDGDPSIVGCIRVGALQLQSDPKQFGAGDWYADCNGDEYYFGLRGGKWLLAGYQNINE